MQESQMKPENCTLEPVPKTDVPSAYIYSVPSRSSLCAADRPPQHEYLNVTQTPLRRRRGIFWQFLLCLLIAVVAGLAGGFIGKKIENNSWMSKADQQTQSTSCTTQVTTTLTTSSPTSSPTTKSESTDLAFKRTLPVPDTGCNPKDTQKSFRGFSAFLDIQHTTFCNTGWLSDDLVAVSVATASDCIEACAIYNNYRGSNSKERACVGGGFIPEWWNQTQAMAESGVTAFNCFLKSNDSNIGRNDRDIEVVSLCLPGNCQDVLG